MRKYLLGDIVIKSFSQGHKNAIIMHSNGNQICVAALVWYINQVVY